ncbi:MAG: SEC-C metal-binding domain-containing protein [Nitrososphaerota archaeon]
MECTTESCNMEKNATCPCGSDKPYQECCGCQTVDPIEQTMMMWHKAFFQALHEAQVERLKKRIESGFGPIMDKSADAVFEAIGKVWNSMLTQSEAKKELASKLQKIFSETSRR